MFVCSDCGEELPVRLLAGGRKCLPCVYRQRKSRWYGSLPSYLGRLKTWAKKRAKKRGLSFDLDREHLERTWNTQRGRCALTGIPMTRPDASPETTRADTNVSLDRIDSGRGYVVGNVQLVCHRANQIKGSLSHDELLFWVRKIKRKLESDLDSGGKPD